MPHLYLISCAPPQLLFPTQPPHRPSPNPLSEPPPPLPIGAQGICLGDMADFWKSFVQELRFLWEEGASVPSMVNRFAAFFLFPAFAPWEEACQCLVYPGFLCCAGSHLLSTYAGSSFFVFDPKKYKAAATSNPCEDHVVETPGRRIKLLPFS